MLKNNFGNLSEILDIQTCTLSQQFFTSDLTNYHARTQHRCTYVCTCRSSVVRDWQSWLSRLWWEISIKVSGRLIMIQSGGGLRYQLRIFARFSSVLFFLDANIYRVHSALSFLITVSLFFPLFLLFFFLFVAPRSFHRIQRITEKRSLSVKIERGSCDTYTRKSRRIGATERKSTGGEPPARKTLRDR